MTKRGAVRGKDVRLDPAGSEDLSVVRALFTEYADGLGVDLSFQGFERELAELPGDYSPPDGRLLLAWDGTRPIGCIALRKLEDGVCEMKRLYVRPAARGAGLGRRMVAVLIDQARAIGYTRMRLDTLPSMGEAVGLYRSLGFVPIAPYRANPVPGAMFLELALR
jgi:ribosomal protein S18 acetylase RimI-like enzyme